MVFKRRNILTNKNGFHISPSDKLYRFLIVFNTANKLSPLSVIKELKEKFPRSFITLGGTKIQETESACVDASIEIPDISITGSTIKKIRKMLGHIRSENFDVCLFLNEGIYGPEYGNLKVLVFKLLTGIPNVYIGRYTGNCNVDMSFAVLSLYNLLIARFIIRNKPLNIQVEPTNRCNLSCLLCSSGANLISKRGDMNISSFKKIIDEISPFAETLTLHNLGEPFLNPDLIDMISYAKKQGVFTRVDTNGNVRIDAAQLVKSGVDVIQIAMDGTTQENYVKYRKKGELKKVLENAGNIVAAKKKTGS